MNSIKLSLHVFKNCYKTQCFIIVYNLLALTSLTFQHILVLNKIFEIIFRKNKHVKSLSSKSEIKASFLIEDTRCTISLFINLLNSPLFVS